MKFRIRWCISSILILLAAGCRNGEFRETPGGLKYKIVRAGTGPVFREGEYIVLNMEYYNSGDSILYSSLVRGMPVTMQYKDSIWRSSGLVYEGLAGLKTGDSAIFKVRCDDLYLKSFRMPVPNGLNPKEIITFRVGVVKTMNEKEYKEYQGQVVLKQQAAREQNQRQQLIEDLGIIDRTLDEKNIIPMETESGLRYVVNREGRGRKPQEGENVVISYKGTLLDGTVFESTENIGKPYEFPLGLGVVIKGWDEGISLMPEGSLYTFYIPSPLGYAERSPNNIIRPNSILVFEIELLEIKKN